MVAPTLRGLVEQEVEQGVIITIEDHRIRRRALLVKSEVGWVCATLLLLT